MNLAMHSGLEPAQNPYPNMRSYRAVPLESHAGRCRRQDHRTGCVRFVARAQKERNRIDLSLWGGRR